MKTRISALLAVCAALSLVVPTAQASVKNKIYSVNGTAFVLAGPIFQSQPINNAIVNTTSPPSVTVSNVPIIGSVSGVITSENDFPSVNVAIANGTVIPPAPGIAGTFTAIQIGQTIYIFASVNGSFSGLPLFGFVSGSGQQTSP